MGTEFTLKDPRDTYLSILQLGDDNDSLQAVVTEVVYDGAGFASLLELSQSVVAFTGIMSATVAGLVMATGVPLEADTLITDALLSQTDNDAGLFFTSGDPEGSLTAPIGSVALRLDGSSDSTLYVKEAGVGNTGWVAMMSTATFIDLPDTPIAYAADQWLAVNGAGDAVVFVAPPASNLVDLDDCPTYDDGKWLKSGVASFTLEDLPASSFFDLTDVTPTNYADMAGALVAVNAAENALEFVLDGATEGTLAYFDGSNWVALPPDTAGKVLITQGVGAAPQWDVASAGGSNDPDAIHVNVAGEINGLTSKATPAAGDLVVIEDVVNSYNKKKVEVGTLLGNDATAIHTGVSGEINGLTEKATPVDDDIVVIEDSAATYGKKKVKLSHLIGGGSDPADVPIYGSGVGPLTLTGPSATYLWMGDASLGESGRLYIADVIKAVHGGEAVPTWEWYFTMDYGGGPGETMIGPSSDPTTLYFDMDADTYSGQVLLKVDVSDGVNYSIFMGSVITDGYPSLP